MLSAAAVGLALSSVLSVDQFTAWGWRVPFVIGAILGPVVYVIRRNADESGVFLKEAQSTDVRPTAAAPFFARCVIGVGAVLACTVTIYFLVYIPTFAQTSLGAGAKIAYTTGIVSGATLLIVCPFAGFIADRIGILRQSNTVEYPVSAIILRWSWLRLTAISSASAVTV